MRFDVGSNFVDLWNIVVSRGRSQQALMKHAQPQKLRKTKTRKKTLPTNILCDARDVPFTASNLRNEYDRRFFLYLLDTVKFVCKLKEIFNFESIAIADETHKSQQRHELPDRWSL